MSEKNLRSLKLETPANFRGFLNVLWDELYWANFYYDIFNEARRLCKEHEAVVRFSPNFWHFTLQAHCQTALVYLHRIYDQNRDSFNLHRFLLTVRDNLDVFCPTEMRKRLNGNPHADDLVKAIGKLDTIQLARDIEFASNGNSKVANLNRWRNRVTFHRDERELSRKTPFEEEHPLPFADIDKLLDEGFRIMNRYSQHFEAAERSRGCREWKDMRFVFEALKHHPHAVRDRAE